MLRPLTLVALILALAPLSRAQETQRLYLSGHDKSDAVDWDFTCSAGNNANKPSKIKVPSNWELQNFGTLTYGRDIPRNQNFPQITGHYQHTFTLPASFADHHVFLVFEGAMTDTTVRINGHPAGPTHQGGFYRFSYDVTNLLRPGQNTLQADVDQESADPSVNRAERRADFWNFAGIYRPVYLEALPQTAISHLAINATADGHLSATLTTLGHPASLEAQILNTDGTPAASPITSSLTDETGVIHLDTSLPNPKTWSAETPNLYALQLTLKDPANKPLHTLKQSFGFRTIEIREPDPAHPDTPAGLFVNGRRVMLKGANRHSFWPDSGRCLSLDNMQTDLTLMKQMNMNGVRCSHYPPDAAFLDLCDQQGMYVLDELTGWQSHYDDPVGHKLVKELVDRDVNHPSVLFWDNGNEGGFNNNLNDDFAKYDPQRRPVLHPWELFRGIDTKHYPSYAVLTEKLAAPNVFFPTEMLHGLFDGGAGASLEDYWNAMLASKVSAGGFIWALLDEDVKRPDTGQLDGRGNQAPDGILGPYRQKEASFLTIKQLWSPIVLSINSPTLPADFDGTLQLDNRYSFTHSSQCTFEWQLRTFPAPAEPGANDTGYKILSHGTAKSDVAPNSKGTLHLNLPPTWKDADALAVRALDPTGQELWTFVFPTPRFSHHTAEPRDAGVSPAQPPIPPHETDTTLTLTTPAGSFTFNKQTAQLTSFKDPHGTVSPLSNGPRLLASGDLPDSTLTSFAYNPTTHTITATFTGPLNSIDWTFTPPATLTCHATYTLTGPRDYFGLGFDLPEKSADNTPVVSSFRWLGNGPYRAYKNRLPGGSLNVWQTPYNDTITGFRDWTYPEFKGYYANVHWAQLLTPAGTITLTLHDPDHRFLQLLTPSLPTGPDPKLLGKTAVPYPPAGLSILHAIPPIGSKFTPPNVTGPQAHPTPATGTYHTSFTLHFTP